MFNTRVSRSTVLAGALVCAGAALACVAAAAGERASERESSREERGAEGGAAGLAAPGSAGDTLVSDSTAGLRVRIDASSPGSPISPYIYGVNFYGRRVGSAAPQWPAGLTLSRFGGNRLTAYNWENNASNAGSDYNFQNDGYLSGSDVPGEAVRAEVAGAAARGAGTIVTVPMIGFVARDKDQTSVGTRDLDLVDRLARRFVVSRPRKGTPFGPSPDVTDQSVSQDEFVAWLSGQFPGAVTDSTHPIFFALDNEPDLWGSTHEEIRPKVGGVAPAMLTYDDLIARTVEYASAIKAAAPGAVVFGPGVATWAGAATLGQYPRHDPRYGRAFFLDVYLDRLREAERTSGRRLVDVLDLHWYPAAGSSGSEIGNDHAPQTPKMIEARLQAPRSLWDSTYDERSWVSEVQGGPIRLLPLLKEKIANHYPGTKIAITEYYYGRGGDISGGIAQADVLGVFGREGVFAATLWPNAGVDAAPYGGNPERAYAYVNGAFRMFRDFDGDGGAFGDRALPVRLSDSRVASVYASADSRDPASSRRRLVIVAINKSPSPLPARITLAGLASELASAAAYTLTAGSPKPVRGADAKLRAGGTLVYEMPPLSVTTLVVRP